jgi:hypothetical protein
MIGMVIDPVVTTSDVGLPESIPYIPDEITATFAGPPEVRPLIAAAKLKKKSPPPQAWSTVPNITNIKAYVAATRIGKPNIPSVVKTVISRKCI